MADKCITCAHRAIPGNVAVVDGLTYCRDCLPSDRRVPWADPQPGDRVEVRKVYQDRKSEDWRYTVDLVHYHRDGTVGMVVVTRTTPRSRQRRRMTGGQWAAAAFGALEVPRG